MPFIVFEGGEGVGKSTQIARLSAHLRSQGYQVTCTREPGGTPFAEKLRTVFKQNTAAGDDEPTPWAELLVVAAARAQHLEKMIRPLLAQKVWVISDRFLDSAYVYQGKRAKLGSEQVLKVHENFMKSEDCPDLTFVLDLEAAVAKQRLKNRSDDRLDQAGLGVFEELRSGFLELVHDRKPYPFQKNVRRVVIDASRNEQEVAQEIWQVVAATFGKAT